MTSGTFFSVTDDKSKIFFVTPTGENLPRISKNMGMHMRGHGMYMDIRGRDCNGLFCKTLTKLLRKRRMFGYLESLHKDISHFTHGRVT